MKHSHYDLKSRLVHLWVLVNRNTTSVVLNSNRVVLVDCNLDVGTKARHCFINRVIDSLVYEMVKALF